jgi:hypothetical protein
MARYSAGVKTAAGSTTLPIMSLYAAAASAGSIYEIGVFNTTATAVDLKLVRLTSAATQGAGLVEAKHNPDSVAASCTAFTTHSSTGPTLGDDLGFRASLGAAIGAGMIWTFGSTGLRIPVGVANGVGVIVENGTGQVCQAYFVWEE